MTQAFLDTGELPGLSGPKQAATAFRLARKHWIAMLIAWAAFTLIAWGAAVGMKAIGYLALPAVSPTFLGFVLLQAVAGAVVSALVLRTLLDRPPVALDGGVLAYVGLITLFTVVPTVLGRAYAGTPPTDAGDTQAVMAYGLKNLGQIVLTVVLGLALLKLMLWPIGLAVGDPEVTPSVSWRLTHRAFWGYIVAMILLCAVPWLISFGLTAAAGMGQARTVGAAPMIPLAATPFMGLTALAAPAVGAALFWLRRSGADEAMATFD